MHDCRKTVRSGLLPPPPAPPHPEGPVGPITTISDLTSASFCKTRQTHTFLFLFILPQRGTLSFHALHLCFTYRHTLKSLSQSARSAVTERLTQHAFVAAAQGADRVLVCGRPLPTVSSVLGTGRPPSLLSHRHRSHSRGPHPHHQVSS